MFFDSIDNPIGLDISELSVKLCQISKRPARLELTAYCDVSLPKGYIVHDIIENPEGLSGFLAEVFNKKSYHTGKIKGRSVVASIPESKAFVRIITMPKLDAEELATAIPIEAEQYIPLPIDQVETDWELVEESNNETKVLITATPKDYINSLVGVLEGAGLVPSALEVESAAIARALLANNNDTQPTILLDMDTSRTSLIVYSGGTVQFTSSIPIAGDAITNAIASRFGVAYGEAERIKRLHGVPVHNYEAAKETPQSVKFFAELKAALEPVLSGFYDEVKNTIKFHEDHSGSNGQSPYIAQVYVCGGTAKLPNLTDYMQAKFYADPYFAGRKVAVSLGNPWQNIVEVGPPPFSRREALSYTTALGLALRNHT